MSGTSESVVMPRHLRPSRCWNCYTSLAKSTCSKCRVARYCSSSCQVSDWKNKASGHKTDCADWALCGIAVMRADKDVLYESTMSRCDGDQRSLDHALMLTQDLASPEAARRNHAAQCSEEYMAKNMLLKYLEDDEDLKNVVFRSISPHWIVNLLQRDFDRVGPSPMPDGLMALSVFLLRAHNQAWPFRAKQWLASEDSQFLHILIKYGHHLALVKRHSAALQFWRLCNCLVVHPVCATAALRVLHSDQQTASKPITTLLGTMMGSEALPDNLQGLVYQFIALIEEQSEDEDRCGIDKRKVIAPIVPMHGGYTIIYSRAKPMVREYIAASKNR